MPKGINKDGSPKTRPVNAGRTKKQGKKKGPYKFVWDVVNVLESKKNATDYLESLVSKDAGFSHGEPTIE